MPQHIKFSVKVLLLLTAGCAIIFAFYRWRIDRQSRIETASEKLVTACTSGDSVSTSNAFRYLRKIGIHESRLALKHFDSTFMFEERTRMDFSNYQFFMRENLPFLFEPVDGLPLRSKFMTYSKGLIFGCHQNGHKNFEEIDLSKIADQNLKFSDLTFIPDDDLWGACEQAISQFQEQLMETSLPSLPSVEKGSTPIQYIEYWLYYYVTRSVRNLRPGEEFYVVPKEFLQNNTFEWDEQNERYEFR